MNLPYEDRLLLSVHLLTLVTNSIMFLVVLFLLNPEKNIFHHFIVKTQMLIDFSLFWSKKKRLLVNLAHCLKFIMSEL